MPIHEEIKRKRLALGLSQTQLAVAVSHLEGLAQPLSVSTVQQWEKVNGTAPKHKRLQHVAQALQTTVPALLGHGHDTDSPPQENPWPLQSTTPERLAQLPQATLDRIDAFICEAAGLPPPIDWRHTARSLAAAVDMQLRTDHHTQFVKALEQHFDSLVSASHGNEAPQATRSKPRTART